MRTFSASKTYPFSTSGYNRLKADMRNEKINRYVSIGTWSVIALMTFGGVLGIKTIIGMITCSGTAKITKMLIK